tara:strand:+ start:223 stop:675 length:453 start_codon:yes stop_codon:yes gene_type:complete
MSKIFSRKNKNYVKDILDNDLGSGTHLDSAEEKVLEKLTENASDSGLMNTLREQHDQEINEILLKIIQYRQSRKWYATLFMILIFAIILGMIIRSTWAGTDIAPEWKEIMLIMLGAFVASFSKVVDFWFNNAENDNRLLEHATTSESREE